MTKTNNNLTEFVAGLNKRDGKPIAIVVGLTETGLAVARSLSKKGICVIGIIFGSGLTPSVKSRHLNFLRGPDIRNEDEALQFYNDLGTAINRKSVLLPTGDENLLFIYKHKEKLKQNYHFYIWESETLVKLASKITLASLANQYDLPVPTTLFVKNRDELDNIADKIRFPVVIKPEFTYLWETDAARKLGIFAVKALPIDTPEELLKIYNQLKQVSPRFIIQQKIIGPDENHVEYPALVEEDGNIKTDFVAFKIRVAPAHYGMGCFVESTKSDEVVRTGRKILKSLGYKGLAMVQFKRDDLDNKLYLLEINPRFTVWTGLPVACGIDFPHYYYQYCLGEPYTVPDSYIVGKRWWNPLRDVFAMQEYIKDGTWTWGKWFISILSFPENAYFTWDDPLPGIFTAMYIFKRIFQSFKRKIFH